MNDTQVEEGKTRENNISQPHEESEAVSFSTWANFEKMDHTMTEGFSLLHLIFTRLDIQYKRLLKVDFFPVMFLLTLLHWEETKETLLKDNVCPKATGASASRLLAEAPSWTKDDSELLLF